MSSDLIRAFRHGQIEPIAEFLEGKDLDAKYREFIPYGSYGITPLELAVKEHEPKIIDFLLDMGADPNVPNLSDGQTPLEYAITNRNTDLFYRVLDHPRLDVTTRTSQMVYRALMGAMSVRRLDMFQALLDHGAYIHSNGVYGHVVATYNIAQRREDSSTKYLEMLMHYGASIQYLVDHPPAVADKAWELVMAELEWREQVLASPDLVTRIMIPMVDRLDRETLMADTSTFDFLAQHPAFTQTFFSIWEALGKNNALGLWKQYLRRRQLDSRGSSTPTDEDMAALRQFASAGILSTITEGLAALPSFGTKSSTKKEIAEYKRAHNAAYEKARREEREKLAKKLKAKGVKPKKIDEIMLKLLRESDKAPGGKFSVSKALYY